MKYFYALTILVILILLGAVVFAAAATPNQPARAVGGLVAALLLSVIWILAGLLENLED